MFSLLETVERLRASEPVSDQDLRALQNSTNPVERFLAHTSLSLLSMQAARDHLVDALRAIDHADQPLLQTFIELSGLLKQHSGVSQVAVKYGIAMIERRQWTIGFEAFRQAIQFDQFHDRELLHDQSVWADVSAAFELASRTLGRSVHASAPRGGPLRVGMLVSQLADNSPTQRLVSGWLRHANPEMASLRVYSTETLAKPLRHRLQLSKPIAPSIESGTQVLAELKARRVEPWLSPMEVDAIQTSRMLTERIVRDQIEFLFVDSTLADATIGMAVAGRPAACQVAIDRGLPVPISGIDQVIHVNSHSLCEPDPFWASRSIRSRTIFQGVEANVSTAANRRDYGLADDAIVMMTCCEDVAEGLSTTFAKMVARLLAENPRAVYLVAGEGESSVVRSVFEEAGVSKRTAFANKLKDPSAFIGMSDVYLAEFPRNSRDGILNAMSAAKPVMVLAGDHDESGNARFVGAPYAIVGSPATLLDRCNAMLRDPQLRVAVGTSLKRRVAEKFGLRNTIDEMLRMVSDEVNKQRKSSNPQAIADVLRKAAA